MAHAMETIAECGILRAHPLLTFRSGIYSYRIERKGSDSLYTVSDGAQSFTVPIKYAIGLGSAGQTYVFEWEGRLYESIVSYFKEIDALDITLGDQNARATNLLQAAGRELSTGESTLCFNCHSTNAVSGSKLDLAALTPGVQCERCHGETQHHLDGLAKGDTTSFAMKSLKGMSAEDTSHFCGQCHRTWEQIASSGPRGAPNVRFQPYRLTNSRCYDPEDKRIACVACHDPHQEIDRVANHYDSKCQACHAPDAKPTAKLCPVGTSNCSTCHMPKIELAGGHHKFADHEIRIVRAKSPYPD